jgi:sugar lactone lactonase YvrE
VRRISVTEPVIRATATLGEGPAWDANHSALVWVDILEKTVHLHSLSGGAPRVFRLETHVGAALPASGGGWLVVLRTGFAVLEENGTVNPLLTVHGPEQADLRFNDAKTDPSGRAWAGSMGYDERPGAGALYRLDSGPTARVILHKVGVSNGLGWSPDRGLFYYVDSLAGALRAFDYSDDSGEIANARVIAELRQEDGYFDGLCVDDEGCIWVAVWDGRCVRRYTPDGELDTVVEVPVDRPTSCCFGPGGMLYITSARHGIPAARLRGQPLAGSVFAVSVEATAQPATLWQTIDAAVV